MTRRLKRAENYSNKIKIYNRFNATSTKVNSYY